MIVTARDITRAQIARVVETGEQVAGGIFGARPWIVFARGGRAFRRPATEPEADAARAIVTDEIWAWGEAEARE